MLFSTEPSTIGAYQTRTRQQKVTMANVSFKSFWCKKCDRARPVTGRKSLGWKAGFCCAECSTAKSAA